MQHLRDADGGYWTGYVYPDDVNWPAEHTTYTAAAVILAADALGQGTAGLGHHARRDAAGRLRARSASSAAARRRLDDGSPAVARRTGAAPASTRAPRPPRRRRPRARAGTRRTAAARRPRGRGKTSWMTSSPPAITQRRPAGVVVLRVLLGVAAVDEQQRQGSAPVRRDGRGPPDDGDDLVLEPGPGDGARGTTGSVSIRPSSGRPGSASWCSQPAWFSSEPRWWSTVNTVPPTSRAAAPR